MIIFFLKINELSKRNRFIKGGINFELLFRLNKRTNYGMCESGIFKKGFSSSTA